MTDINIKMNYSKRMKNIPVSPIRKVMDKAKDLKESGFDVVSFSAGEPNFNTPKDIKAATIAALNDNLTHYGSNRGALKLREKISEKLYNELNVSYNPNTEILVTVGGAEAINNAILAVVDEGDEVIVFTPAFISYKAVVALSGAKFVEIPLGKENDFQIDVKELEEKITDKTKLIIINNPCNPTGVVYNKETLEAVSKLACKYDLLVFSDEIYSTLIYDDFQYCSMASFPGMKERTIVMNGFSKAYAMTGWRLGYIASTEELINNIVRVHQYTTTCAPTFIEEGVAKGMDTENTKIEVKHMVDKFAERRKVLLSKLDEIEKLSYVDSKGAFYLFVDVSKTGLTGEEFATKLLEEKYVATVPGVGLGDHCGDFIRISFATSDEDIIRGAERIKEFVEKL